MLFLPPIQGRVGVGNNTEDIMKRIADFIPLVMLLFFLACVIHGVSDMATAPTFAEGRQYCLQKGMIYDGGKRACVTGEYL